MINGISFLVMETSTGISDGWYGTYEYADEKRTSFKAQYPKGNWIVLQSSKPGEYGRIVRTWHNEPEMLELLQGLK